MRLKRLLRGLKLPSMQPSEEERRNRQQSEIPHVRDILSEVALAIAVPLAPSVVIALVLFAMGFHEP
jgi:hypothetical protein